MEDQKYTVDYINLFDPEAYLKTYFSDIKGDKSEGDVLEREMQFLHEAFAENDIKGRQLLDIGTGPVIHSVISASPHVDNIFLSDYAPQNRATLKKWLDGTLQHSFESLFNYVVKMEGKGECPTDREHTLKTKISGILSIDLKQGYPLAPSLFPQFDVITSSLCLEAAAESLDVYEKMAAHIAPMLKDGGYLVLFSVLDEELYKVGNELFWSLPVTGEQIQCIWKRHGFDVVSWKQGSHSNPKAKLASQLSGYCLMVAKKCSLC